MSAAGTAGTARPGALDQCQWDVRDCGTSVPAGEDAWCVVDDWALCCAHGHEALGHGAQRGRRCCEDDGGGRRWCFARLGTAGLRLRRLDSAMRMRPDTTMSGAGARVRGTPNKRGATYPANAEPSSRQTFESADHHIAPFRPPGTCIDAPPLLLIAFVPLRPCLRIRPFIRASDRLCLASASAGLRRHCPPPPGIKTFAAPSARRLLPDSPWGMPSAGGKATKRTATAWPSASRSASRV